MVESVRTPESYAFPIQNALDQPTAVVKKEVGRSFSLKNCLQLDAETKAQIKVELDDDADVRKCNSIDIQHRFA